MDGATLRVMHAPCHGPTLTRAEIARALKLGAASIGWTEAYNRSPYLRTRPGYRYVGGKSLTDPRRGAKDNPILVARRLHLVDRGAYKACGPSEPRRIAPERWTTSATYDTHGLTVEHIALHPNAGVQHAGDVDRRRKYARQMRMLEHQLQRALEDGHEPVVTGDLNWRGDSHHDPGFAPGPMFARLGMRVWSDGLDWVAWHPRRLHLPDDHQHRRVITANGQDHPWLLADFEIRLNPKGHR